MKLTRKNVALIASVIIGLALLAYISMPHPAKYEDVSSSPEYSNIIGTERATTEDMYILGITTDGNYPKTVTEYRIYPQPGIGGREVVSKDILKKGTVFKITKIEKCTTCFDKTARRYSVDIIKPLFENDQKPVYIPEYRSRDFSNVINRKTVQYK